MRLVRRNVVSALGSVFLLAACGDDDAGDADDGATEVDDTICDVQYRWSPGAGDLSTFPTAELLVDDDSTGTGKKVHLTEADYPSVSEFGRHANVVTEHLSTLDGFGIQGDVFFGFEGTFDPAAIPADSAEPGPSDPAGIVVMPADAEPYLAPVGYELTDEDSTLMMHPLFPLPESTMVATWVKRDFEAAGNCVGASEGMREMLTNAASEEDPALAALVELGVVEGPQDLAVLHAFPTQTATAQSRAVASYIAGLPDDGRFALTGHDCSPSGDGTKCTSLLAAADFRDESDSVPWAFGEEAVPQEDWNLVVHAWLPGDGTDGPYPVAFYGHGLTQSASDGDAVADVLNPLGIAVVGISAVVHGDHPSVDAPLAGLAATLAFFAVDVSGGTLDTLVLRDHLRQSTYDKLYVTRALQAGADLDGDGNGDVDPDRMAYFGVSLGGVMGGEFASLTDAYGAAVLNVPGGRVTTVMTTPDAAFEDVKAILLPSEFAEGTARRLFAIVQTILDGGDPSSYAGAIVQSRFSNADPMHVLMTAVLDDGTVPNPANWALARALGIPLIPPELRPVVGVPVGAAAPVTNNMQGVTAGMLQFDVIDADGTMATHNNTVFSEVGAEAWSTFLDSFFTEGTPRIIDPYDALGIPHAG